MEDDHSSATLLEHSFGAIICKVVSCTTFWSAILANITNVLLEAKEKFLLGRKQLFLGTASLLT
jgi:hypothetical protein